MSKKPVKSKAAESSKNSNRNRLVIGVVVVAFLALIGLMFVSGREPAGIEGVVEFPRPAQGHDDGHDHADDDHTDLPPVGGIHSSAWQNCGIYDQPIEVGNAAHSMEHGAVWITYQPDLDADSVASLQDKVRGTTYLILSPYPGLRSPVVMTAWGLQLELDSAEDKRIDQFIERYRSGPQTPERGASCTDGVGQPLS